MAKKSNVSTNARNKAKRKTKNNVVESLESRKPEMAGHGEYGERQSTMEGISTSKKGPNLAPARRDLINQSII